MPPSEDQPTYGFVARNLHWIVVLLVAAQVVVGWTMPHVRKGTPQQGLVDLRLSLGVILMLVVIVRLLWRLAFPTPPAATLARWERIAARLTHEGLYALLLVLPVLGWAAAGYFGFKPTLFGLFTLPALADGTQAWAHAAGDVHGALTNVMLGLIGLHALAALWHYAVRRDGVLQRMVPWL